MMIEFEKAFEMMMGHVRCLDTETVALQYALNRVLVEDVVSDIDMPPFNKSAMDGFACRREDLGDELEIVETIPAGYCPRKTIGRKRCSRIMTGAVVPEGADCVIMVEKTNLVDEHHVRFTGDKTGDNICTKGQDVRKGDVVLWAGQVIRPQHIAILAAFGCDQVSVSIRPEVAILATGDELVEPGVRPESCQIRNSNSYQLAAQIEKMGIAATYYGIAKDTEQAIEEILNKAIAENDVVLISGGVSEGDYDYVRTVLRKNDIRLIFDRLAIKPGKPTVFGVAETAFFFGLPGNPVSTFVLFEVLVQPFLYQMMGHTFQAVSIRLPLARDINRKHSERKSWIPITISENGVVMPVEYHGSAHISALCDAQGIMEIPIGLDQLKEGTMVDVRCI